ncbi:unnamed protein product, partial [Choristocarpus tenellus]
HVDDLLVTGKIDVLIWVRSRIKEQFSIEDLGDLEYYMGFEISCDRNAQIVTISQTRYIKSVCQRFGMDGAKKRSVPHDLSRALDKSENDPNVDENTPVGLIFGGFDTECELSAYADASYARDCNDRRSVTGGAIMFAGGAISWSSKVQRVVALFSTES